MTLQTLVSNNYEYLNTVAKRIVRSRNYSMADDLLSETYKNMAEKQTPFPCNDQEFVKWFSKCMKNYFSWPNSSFNKIFFSKEYLTLDKEAECNYEDNNLKYSNDIADHDALSEIELSVEETNEITREIIEISSSLGKTKTLQYLEVIEFKRTLFDHEKILFELYYENGLSTRDIAALSSTEQYKINYQSINTMVNQIKEKIKEKKWKQ